MLSPRIWRSAVAVDKLFRSLGYQFCIIGGIAVQRWGEPRITRDVDITLLTGFGKESAFIDTLLAHFEPRIENAKLFAIRARVLLVIDDRDTPLDISLAGMPFESQAIERSSSWGTSEFGSITTCSAEDLVILKAFAARPQDWIDIENVLIRQGKQLNRDLVLNELEPLVALKEEPEILERLKALFDRIS